jgi:hypothetical protein
MSRGEYKMKPITYINHRRCQLKTLVKLETEKKLLSKRIKTIKNEMKAYDRLLIQE